MKCYTVVAMTTKGEYKSVYLGNDLAAAKQVNRSYKQDLKGKDCIAVFFFPKPYSKRVSGEARHFEALEKERKAKKREEVKKAPAKKEKKADK